MAVNAEARPCMDTAHELPFIAEKKAITWERLETLRLQKLGIGNRYSRHFNVTRKSNMNKESNFDLCASSATNTPRFTPRTEVDTKSNSIAPFTTVAKPTCGYFFSTGTNHKKLKFGIPPSDLVKWRSYQSNNH